MVKILRNSWSDADREFIKSFINSRLGHGIIEIDVFGRYLLVLELSSEIEIIALVEAEDTSKSADLHKVDVYWGFDTIDEVKYLRQGYELVISHSEQELEDGTKLTRKEVAKIEVLTKYGLFALVARHPTPPVVVRKRIEHIECKEAKPIGLEDKKVFAQV